jgi:TRAP-type C4-dicarboxylate transport system substrate-binding protein
MAASTTSRHTARLLLAASALAFAALSGAPAPAIAQDAITIRLTSPVPRGPAHVEAIQWWADEVAKRAGDRIEFQTFYAGSLMGALETLPATRDGRVGGGYMSPGYWPAELPLWSVDSIPFMTDDPYAMMLTFYDLSKNNESMRKELETAGIKLMFMVPVTPAVSGVREPVTALKDLDGKRLRVLGYVARAFQTLGVQPVSIDPGQQYEAIQRGALDGFGSLVFDAIPYFKLYEVAPNLYYTGIGMYSSVGVGISLELWNEIPEDLQKIMTEVAEEYMFQREPAALMTYEEDACTKLLDAKATVTLAPEAEVEAWKGEVGETIKDAWHATVVEKGVAPEIVDAFYDDYAATLAKYEAESKYELGVAKCAARSG